VKILREASAAKREDTSLQGIAKRFMGKFNLPFFAAFLQEDNHAKKATKAV